jgi:hypothetical protein
MIFSRSGYPCFPCMFVYFLLVEFAVQLQDLKGITRLAKTVCYAILSYDLRNVTYFFKDMFYTCSCAMVSHFFLSQN